jgi:hypothetical protein
VAADAALSGASRPNPWCRALQAFVVLMPFLHAFGLGTWGPVPLLFAGATLIAAITVGAFRWIWLEKSDLYLVGMALFGVLAIAAHSDYAGEKNLNHTAAVLLTIIVFYIWMRAWILRSRITIDQLGAAATLGLLVSSAAIIFEFWAANGPGYYLADVIPYSTEELPFALVFEDWRRPRGLAAEPGFSAMVFEALGPLATAFLLKRRSLFLLCSPVIACGFALLFSAGAISALLLSAVILAIGGRAAGVKLLVLAGAVAAVAAIAVFAVGGQLTAWFFDELIGRKVLDLVVQGDVNVGEAAGRYEAYRAGIEMFTTYPFGIGWGMVSEMFDSGRALPGLTLVSSRGLISLYLEILVSAGVLGFASYAAFHIGRIRKAATSLATDAPYVFFGLVALSLHHAFVLEFWFPMLWFYFALADALTARERVTLRDASTASSESISLGRPPLTGSDSGGRITSHEVAWDH